MKSGKIECFITYNECKMLVFIGILVMDY